MDVGYDGEDPEGLVMVDWAIDEQRSRLALLQASLQTPWTMVGWPVKTRKECICSRRGTGRLTTLRVCGSATASGPVREGAEPVGTVGLGRGLQVRLANRSASLSWPQPAN